MTSKKHILVLSSWYPTQDMPFVGNFVQRQAKLFATKFQVTVLHTKSDESINELKIVEHTEGNFREIVIYHPKEGNLFQKFQNQKKAFKTGLKLIQNVTLIHAHVLLPKGLQFIQAKKHFKCPLLVTEHGSYFRPEARSKRSLVDTLILSKVKRHIDQLTAVSEFSKKDLQLDFPAFKIDILPNHIDTSVFIPQEKEKRRRKEFLHISTLDEQLKNPKGIIDACKKLVDEGTYDFHLTIICDESFEKWLNYSDAELLSDYITFHGAKKWGELVQFYQQSDAFILFSTYETFSIVLTESWSCGIPTLTTPVGIGYNLPEKLGIQVEINSVESLSTAMKTIIHEERVFDSSVIRSYAEPYSGEKIISIFEKIILMLDV